MAYLIKIHKNGLIEFLSDKEYNFLCFTRRIGLSCYINDARIASPNYFEPMLRALKLPDGKLKAKPYKYEIIGDRELYLYKYYVVIRATKYLRRTRYYSYDKEYYSKKFHRRVSKPVFDKDINKAEFIKSKKYADEVATRCRQTGREMVAVREVYVYRENELLQKNIVVVLRHKENEKVKPQFIRTYNKADGGFTKTSRYDQAIHFTYDEYLDLYEQFQALHKDYFVLPKIIDDGNPWSGKAKDVDGREQVEGTLRLRSK